MNEYTEIRDMSGREPVGAVLRIGRKNERGVPVERDRFTIASRYENERGVRPLLADFAPFNNLSAENRRAFRGNLVHDTRPEAFAFKLSARVLGAGWPQFPTAHPNMRPICEGNGEQATRLFGIDEDGREDWQEIECPNDLCEFRAAKACKPWAKLYFQPRWNERAAGRMPSPEMVFSTGSWNTVANMIGFFEHVAAMASGLGVEPMSLRGLPFILQLGEKRDRKRGHVFPVVSMSVDGNLVDFLAYQKQRVDEIGGHLPQRLIAATDPIETTPDAADYRDVNPGIPSDQTDLFTEPG